MAQVPEKIDFQAVARNAEGALLAHQTVKIRTGIILGPLPGVTVYAEEHEAVTDAYGHFVLPLGTGEVLVGVFSEIDWSMGRHFLHIELDPESTGEYLDMGTLEMMTVPYAFYADRAGNVDDADNDPSNEIQQLSIQGEVLSISGANSVQIPDASSTNELQQLQYSDNNLLSISGGNSVQLPLLSTLWQENGQTVYLEQGRVGIGLSSPPNQLSIYDPNNAGMSFLTSTSGSGQKDGLSIGLNRLSHSAFIWNYEPGDIRMGTNDETRLYINQFGRIGIGTTAPAERLEVNGGDADAGLRIKAGERRKARLSLFETHANNYGFSWEYDGSGKKVYLRSHGFRNDNDDELISVSGNGLITFGSGSVQIMGREGDNSNLSITHDDFPSTALHLGVRNGFPVLDFSANPLLVRAENRLALAIDDDSGYLGVGTDQPRVELDVRGNTEISRNLSVKQNASIEGSLEVGDDAVLEGGLTVLEELNVAGGMTVGGGTSILQIREVTGTTSEGKFVDIPYPSGFTKSNTRVLSLQVQTKSGTWFIQGGDYDSPQRITVYLFDSQIRILNPNTNDFENRPFRLLLLSMNGD